MPQMFPFIHFHVILYFFLPELSRISDSILLQTFSWLDFPYLTVFIQRNDIPFVDISFIQTFIIMFQTDFPSIFTFQYHHRHKPFSRLPFFASKIHILFDSDYFILHNSDRPLYNSSSSTSFTAS